MKESGNKFLKSVAFEVKQEMVRRAAINNGFDPDVRNWSRTLPPEQAGEGYNLTRIQAYSMVYVWENAVRRGLTNFEALRMLIEITSTF